MIGISCRETKETRGKSRQLTLQTVIQKMPQNHGENCGSKWPKGQIPWLQVLLVTGWDHWNLQKRRVMWWIIVKSFATNLALLEWKVEKEERDLHSLEPTIPRFICCWIGILWVLQAENGSHLFVLVEKYHSPRVRLQLRGWSHVFGLPPWKCSPLGSRSLWWNGASLWHQEQAQETHLLIDCSHTKTHWSCLVGEMEPRYLQELQLLLNF